MDNKLTNEEIAKVFAMYVPCIAVYQYKGSSEHNKPFEFSYQGLSFHYKNENLTEIKLPLTPLSKISDEDAIEVVRVLYGMHQVQIIEIKRFNKGVHVYLDSKHGYNNKYNDHVILWFDGKVSINGCKDNYDNNLTHQFYTLKGYAVPLFFAPNHWANGRTAIELGLAIDKTTL